MSETRDAEGGTVKPPGRGGGLLGGAAALLVLLLGKVKALGMVALGGMKFLQLGKVGGTVLTMAASAWFYMSLYGPAFGFLFVMLILVHEVGHGYAAQRMGLDVSAPIFIPGFGAFITLRGQPMSTWQHTVVGAGGPLFGLAGAAFCYALSAGSGALSAAALFRALAFFSAQVNLFNLWPVLGLDGDRVTAALDRRRLGYALAGVVAIGFLQGGLNHGAGPLLALSALLLGIKLVRRWNAGSASAPSPEQAVARILEGRAPVLRVEAGDVVLAEDAEQWRSLALYLGLVAGLAFLCGLAANGVVRTG